MSVVQTASSFPFIISLLSCLPIISSYWTCLADENCLWPQKFCQLAEVYGCQHRKNVSSKDRKSFHSGKTTTSEGHPCSNELWTVRYVSPSRKLCFFFSGNDSGDIKSCRLGEIFYARFGSVEYQFLINKLRHKRKFNSYSPSKIVQLPTQINNRQKKNTRVENSKNSIITTSNRIR